MYAHEDGARQIRFTDDDGSEPAADSVAKHDELSRVHTLERNY